MLAYKLGGLYLQGTLQARDMKAAGWKAGFISGIYLVWMLPDFWLIRFEAAFETVSWL
jgi:hypothetical protein